jgi:hypothetical protein
LIRLVPWHGEGRIAHGRINLLQLSQPLINSQTKRRFFAYSAMNILGNIRTDWRLSKSLCCVMTDQFDSMKRATSS